PAPPPRAPAPPPRAEREPPSFMYCLRFTEPCCSEPAAPPPPRVRPTSDPRPTASWISLAHHGGDGKRVGAHAECALVPQRAGRPHHPGHHLAPGAAHPDATHPRHVSPQARLTAAAAPWP